MMNTVKKFPIGIDSFGEIIRDNKLFVDKSLFIQAFIERDEKATLIIRPRRFGKTLNMSMLEHFFAAQVDGKSTTGLFDNLMISQAKSITGESYLEKYQGKYPVIAISFKGIEGKTSETSVAEMYDSIISVYEKHEYLLASTKLSTRNKQYIESVLDKNDQINLPESLKNLTKMLYQHTNQQCFILIDEYDAPLQTAYNQGYFDDLASFMRQLFSATLKGNAYLAKGIMTGILDLSKNSIFSGLNNMSTYGVLNSQYCKDFGFTEPEVQQILLDQQIVDINLVDLQSWYNGYRIGHIDQYTLVYNPWAIMKCLSSAESGINRFESYWTQTGTTDMVKDLLLSNQTTLDTLRNLALTETETLSTTISQNVNYQNLAATPNHLWTVLLYTGYLTANAVNKNNYGELVCHLKIPNKEIRHAYQTIFMDWLKQSYQAIHKNILTTLTDGDIIAFKDKLSTYLLMDNPNDFKVEKSYQLYMNALFKESTSTHRIDNNSRIAGLGIPDCIISPRDNHQSIAAILEYKLYVPKQAVEIGQLKGNIQAIDNKLRQIAEQEALQQIDNRYYDAIFMQEPQIKQVLHVGIVFYGKCIVMAYRRFTKKTQQYDQIQYVGLNPREIADELARE